MTTKRTRRNCKSNNIFTNLKTSHKERQLLLVGMFFLVLTLIFLLKGPITGLVVQDSAIYYDVPLNYLADENKELRITLDNYPESFEWNSLSITGSIVGEDYVKVYAEFGDQRFLVLDSNNLQPSLIALTGFAVSSSENDLGIGTFNDSEWEGCAALDDPNIPITDDYKSYVFNFEGGLNTSGTSEVNEAEVNVGDHNMTLHVSCSDDYFGLDEVEGTEDDGYGEKDDPSEGEGHPRVSSYQIWKYKIDKNRGKCELDKICGQDFILNDTCQDDCDDGDDESEENLSMITFEDYCEESCMLPPGLNLTEINLIIEVENGSELEITNLEYSLSNLSEDEPDDELMGCAALEDPNTPIDDDYKSYVFNFEGGLNTSGTSEVNEAGVSVDGYNMTLHVSCSDDYFGPDEIDGTEDDGYGEKDDPTESEGHPRVSSYQIWKYKVDPSKDECELDKVCDGNLIVNETADDDDKWEGCAALGDPNTPIGDDYKSYVFNFEGGLNASGTSEVNEAGVSVDGYNMTLHVSCSDDYFGPDEIEGTEDDGYGEKDDPTENEGHPRVSSYQIWKYKVDPSTDKCELDKVCDGDLIVNETQTNETCQNDFSCSNQTENNFEFEMLNMIDNCNGTYTYKFKITNHRKEELSHLAISLPPGVVPIKPVDSSVYHGLHKDYDVENPTNKPFYSIKYETKGKGIKKGEHDIFEFTLDENPGDYEIQLQAKAGRKKGSVTLNCQGSTCGENCIVDQCVDEDNDGFNVTIGNQSCGLTDCNDNNSSINPNATEICDNGVDDDCDGLIDYLDTEECVYNDTDEDGIPDNDDNCIYIFNPTQDDFDNNGIGDACLFLTNKSDTKKIKEMEDTMEYILEEARYLISQEVDVTATPLNLITGINKRRVDEIKRLNVKLADINGAKREVLEREHMLHIDSNKASSELKKIQKKEEALEKKMLQLLDLESKTRTKKKRR